MPSVVMWSRTFATHPWSLLTNVTVEPQSDFDARAVQASVCTFMGGSSNGLF